MAKREHQRLDWAAYDPLRYVEAGTGRGAWESARFAAIEGDARSAWGLVDDRLMPLNTATLSELWREVKDERGLTATVR